ncbi:hypothetical protein [Sporosarcina beigongshangi]|uniref:hypothetical protein n=1 Tax=Sporosarcina beigongshangi TaxID=2782538 RepID=UPI002ACE8B2A|nr:hypothetical protein [Sporosarcina beigongshangi]
MMDLHELIESYNEYIKKMPTGCQKVADSLREDRISEAMQDIIDFSEGANWLAKMSEYFRENGILVNLETGKIHEYLHEVNSGLEIQDYIVVADMFEYEIMPFFDENSQDVKLMI